MPYLNYIKENIIVFKVSAKHPLVMQSLKKYNFLQDNIMFPILKEFDIKANLRKYYATYYVHGVYAIIEEWITGGCAEDTSLICETIINCVRPYEKNYEDNRKS